jgi:hypothetical protein
VKLFDVAIADVTTRLVALSDKGSVISCSVALGCMHEERVPAPIERHEFNTSHYGDFKGDTVQSRQNITDRLNAQKLEVEVENGVGRVAG